MLIFFFTQLLGILFRDVAQFDMFIILITYFQIKIIKKIIY